MDRFRREAILAARIHPHLAHVYDIDRTPERELILARERHAEIARRTHGPPPA